MEFWLLWLGFSIAVAIYAERKGRSGPGWLFFSILLSPLLGLLFVAVLSPIEKSDEAGARVHGEQGDFRKCPMCAEVIRREAVKCKHCSSDVEPLTGKPVSKAFNAGKALAKQFKTPG